MYVAHTPESEAERRGGNGDQAAAGSGSGRRRISWRAGSKASRRCRLVCNNWRPPGVEQALLVAGDLEKPLGPYMSTLDIIDSGLLENSSLKRLGVAGHPEGHKQVADDVLLAALRHKQAFAARTGLKLHIATQFTFDADAIIEWDERLTKEASRFRRISASQVPRRYRSSSSTPWRAAWGPRWAP